TSGLLPDKPGRNRLGRHPRRGQIPSVFMAADQEVPRVPGSPSLYRKVAGDIKAAIAAGGYAAGTRLPSEHELAERYSVSRGTIRQAFAALRADGIIASRRGARRVVVGGPGCRASASCCPSPGGRGPWARSR